VRTEGALTGLVNVIGSTLVNAFSVANRVAATTAGISTNPGSRSGAVTGQLSAPARSLLVVKSDATNAAMFSFSLLIFMGELFIAPSMNILYIKFRQLYRIIFVTNPKYVILNIHFSAILDLSAKV
jgi:hypothetical protein